MIFFFFFFGVDNQEKRPAIFCLISLLFVSVFASFFFRSANVDCINNRIYMNMFVFFFYMAVQYFGTFNHFSQLLEA